MRRVPALMVVLPVYVLFPASTQVPDPAFVSEVGKVGLVSEITPAMVLAPVLLPERINVLAEDVELVTFPLNVMTPAPVFSIVAV
jgi:hypothetical protein